MSNGFSFTSNTNAPVTVQVRAGWAETATFEQVNEALLQAFAESFKWISHPPPGSGLPTGGHARAEEMT